MSVYALLLPGWDQLSIWGADQDYLYAQVTRNDNSDDDGPRTSGSPLRATARSPGPTSRPC